MARAKGDISKFGDRTPSRISGNAKNKNKPGWDKKRCGKKKLAHKNKHELYRVADNIIIKLANMNLPEKVKNQIKQDLRREKRHLKKPRGAVVKHYNNLAETIEKARAKIRKHKSSGASSSSGSGSGGTKPAGTSNVGGPQTYDPMSKSQMDRTYQNATSQGAGPDLSESTRNAAGEEEPSKAFDQFNPEEFANLMLDNPEAAMEQLKKMDMKEMSIAMQMAQQYIQNIQKMMQLQSNLSKVAHKTNTAVIRNIR